MHLEDYEDVPLGDRKSFLQSEGQALRVLGILAEANGLSFDPSRAAGTLRAAAREIPPTLPRAARLRLAYAADAMGLRIVSRSLSTREALHTVTNHTPLALFTITPEGQARWFVLKGRRGRFGGLADLDGDDSEEWLPLEGLTHRLGSDHPDTVLEWVIAQPAAPMAEASRANQSPEHDHHPTHGHGLPPLRRLFGLLKPERSDLILVTLFAVGVGALTLATPVAAMAVVNTVALGTLVQQLLMLCFGLLIALALAGAITLLQTFVVEFIQRRVFVRVAADLAYRLPRVDLRGFDRQNGPELVNRFFDVLTVQKAGATLMIDGVSLVLQIMIGLILLASYHVYLLGFDIFLIGSLIFLTVVLGRGAVRTAIHESICKYRVAGWMEEIARHPVAFKTAGGPQLANDKTDRLTREYLLAREKHFRVLIRQISFALLLQVIANVAVLGIGGFLVIRGDLTLGELVAAEIVVTLVVATFSKFGKQLEAFYDLLAAVDKLGHLLDLPQERSGGERHHSRTSGAAIGIHNVSFTYDRQGRPALKNLDLQLAPGERAALVGPNGVGKSTLVDLLFGLRTPDQGWVEIDGADLRTLRLETLREHVALVKGIEVVEGSVLDNVRMGRDYVTLGDVQDALRRVDLLETVLALPDGLNTPLWTGGSPLSLGQANRLMVARAIVGQPRLMIVDEALDNMDAEVRKRVLPALLGGDARWTLLIVTHSEDVARLCDRVIRLSRNDLAGKET